MADTRSRRPRRQFDPEFKARAARLVLDEGKTVGAVAREADLRQVDAEIERLTAAIAAGAAISALLDALKPRDRHRSALVARLQALRTSAKTAKLDRLTIEQQVCEPLENWRELLGRNVAQTRQLLTKLLRGKLTLTPFMLPDGAPAYELAGEFSLEKLLAGTLPKGMASPTGHGETYLERAILGDTRRAA